MGEVQILIGWKVHIAPPCVSKWDGAFGVHPRG